MRSRSIAVSPRAHRTPFHLSALPCHTRSPPPGLLIVGCAGVPMTLLAFWWLGRMDKLEPHG